MDSYYVVKYARTGAFVAVISGMGRNRGTLDSSHSRRTAQRHAASLRKEDSEHLYAVEGMVVNYSRRHPCARVRA